ncbi:MAG TPA: hypothetical protein VK609_21070, partial [Mucilaginibacter sp.]|nr:hypothetical protein [Mucilaginibacter sp.]
MGKALLALFFCLLSFTLMAQNRLEIPDTIKISDDTLVAQRDLIDIVRSVFNIKPRKISAREKKKIYFSILPISSSDGRSGGKAL